MKPLRKWTLVALGFLTTFVLACSKKEASSRASQSGASSAETSPEIEKMLAGVPGNAVALGFADLSTPPWSYVTGGAGLPLEKSVQQQLDQDLRTYLKTYLGLDLSKVQFAVAFVAGPPESGAVLIQTVEGEPKLGETQEVNGGKVWLVDRDADVVVAMKSGTLAVGTSDAVRSILDTLAGKRTSVVAENKELVSWLRAETKGAAVGLAGIVPQGMPLPGPIAGLRRVAVALGRGGLRAVVDGDDATISQLQSLIDDNVNMALAELKRGREAALAGDLPPPEGAMAIVSAAYATSYLGKLKPAREGNRLIGSIAFTEASEPGMFVVAGIGILAAVAIPAFMEYMNTARQAEVKVELKMMGKNLTRHYIDNAQFPVGDTPLTPRVACCAMPDRKCSPGSDEWKHPIWTTLDIAPDQPHAFQYKYASDGDTALIEAVGDVDCDGTAETYRLEAAAENGIPRIRIASPAD